MDAGSLNGSPSFVGLLAKSLREKAVLFLTGAGLSRNWGMPSSETLAQTLVKRYKELRDSAGTSSISTGRSDLLAALGERDESNLALVAEALSTNRCWFLHLFMSLSDEEPCSRLFWSAERLAEGDPLVAGKIGYPHIIIARLAKEGLIQEIVTTNYDSLLEAGCIAVGMREFEPVERGEQKASLPWVEEYRVVSSAAEFSSLVPRRRLFHIYKIHGSIAHLERYVAPGCESKVGGERCKECGPHASPDNCNRLHAIRDGATFVIAQRDLLDWRHDHWARDLFRDRVRSHHLVIVGFSGWDPVLHASIRTVMEEALRTQRGSSHATEPRVQATTVGRELFIEKLVSSGLGRPAIADNDHDVFYDLKEDADGAERADKSAFRESVDRLFRSVYARCMRDIYATKISGEGVTWVERVWDRKATRGFDPGSTVRSAVERLRTGIETLDERFWVDVLPIWMKFSWFSRSSSDSNFLKQGLRIASPYYYVPLSASDDIVFPLLAFAAALGCWCVANSQPGNWRFEWSSTGWINLTWRPHRKDRHGFITNRKHPLSQVLSTKFMLLPIVGTSDQHFPRHPYLPTSTHPFPTETRGASGASSHIVLLTSRTSGAVDRFRMIGASSGLGTPQPFINPLPVSTLLLKESFYGWLDKLRVNRMKTLKEKGEAVG